MTTFKTKLRKVGNSWGVLIPREVITDYILGEEIELEVITKKGDSDTSVITEKVAESGVHPSQQSTGRLVFNSGKGIYERK